MLQCLTSGSCGRLVQTHRSTWYFAFLVLGYVLYLIFGAVVFSSVELPYEDLLRQELRDVKTRFLQENQCLSDARLERFLEKALEASNYGVSVLNNASANWNWDFTSALFFASTAFCIIYSVMGIPFTLLFLTAVVQRIMVFSTRRPVMYIHTQWGLSKSSVAIVHAAVLATTAISCFFLIPAAIFSALEDDWNFLESFYFCFISLSTIGLGDYVPGEGSNQRFRQLYKVGITVYLLLGLVVMLVVLETFSAQAAEEDVLLKKQKPQDRLAILEHDQLSFTTTVVATPSYEDKTRHFLGDPVLTSPGGDDPMIQ
ncbi:hypothetical protein CRUP_010623 [Coryphaenoides rupestris]|nr:hypothetical protein CRUP_010623 [Coryphaenoides rupestris]